MDAQAKMILILPYHTGRDAMYMRFKNENIQRAYLYQELYFNYVEFFLEEDSVGDSLDVDKEIDLVLSPYGTKQRITNFIY